MQARGQRPTYTHTAFPAAGLAADTFFTPAAASAFRRSVSCSVLNRRLLTSSPPGLCAAAPSGYIQPSPFGFNP